MVVVLGWKGVAHQDWRRRSRSRISGGARLRNANERTGEIRVAGGGTGRLLRAVGVGLRGHGRTNVVCLGGLALEDIVGHTQSMIGGGGGAGSGARIEALAWGLAFSILLGFIMYILLLLVLLLLLLLLRASVTLASAVSPIPTGCGSFVVGGREGHIEHGIHAIAVTMVLYVYKCMKYVSKCVFLVRRQTQWLQLTVVCVGHLCAPRSSWDQRDQGFSHQREASHFLGRLFCCWCCCCPDDGFLHTGC